MIHTLQETNISPKSGILKMIFLFPRWDMLIPWRVYDYMMDMDESISSWYFRLGPGSAHPIPYAAPTSRRIQELVENYNAFLEQVDEHTQCPPPKARWWFQRFFYFHPYLGKIPNLTNIFQRGWNHQPEKHVVPKIQGLESANGLVNLLPLCNNPLHKGIPGIQNAGPKTTNEPLADEIQKINFLQEMWNTTQLSTQGRCIYGII